MGVLSLVHSMNVTYGMKGDGLVFIVSSGLVAVVISLHLTSLLQGQGLSFTSFV